MLDTIPNLIHYLKSQLNVIKGKSVKCHRLIYKLTSSMSTIPFFITLKAIKFSLSLTI